MGDKELCKPSLGPDPKAGPQFSQPNAGTKSFMSMYGTLRKVLHRLVPESIRDMQPIRALG